MQCSAFIAAPIACSRAVNCALRLGFVVSSSRSITSCSSLQRPGHIAFGFGNTSWTIFSISSGVGNGFLAFGCLPDFISSDMFFYYLREEVMRLAKTFRCGWDCTGWWAEQASFGALKDFLRDRSGRVAIEATVFGHAPARTHGAALEVRASGTRRWSKYELDGKTVTLTTTYAGTNVIDRSTRILHDQGRVVRLALDSEGRPTKTRTHNIPPGTISIAYDDQAHTKTTRYSVPRECALELVVTQDEGGFTTGYRFSGASQQASTKARVQRTISNVLDSLRNCVCEPLRQLRPNALVVSQRLAQFGAGLGQPYNRPAHCLLRSSALTSSHGMTSEGFCA